MRLTQKPQDPKILLFETVDHPLALKKTVSLLEPRLSNSPQNTQKKQKFISIEGSRW